MLMAAGVYLPRVKLGCMWGWFGRHVRADLTLVGSTCFDPLFHVWWAGHRGGGRAVGAEREADGDDVQCVTSALRWLIGLAVVP